MSNDNSKQVVRALGIVLVLMVAGFGTAMAISTIVSNHLTDTVEIPEEAVTLSWVSGIPASPAMNIPYSFEIEITGNADIESAFIMLKIDSPGISVGDVSVQYYIGEQSYNVTFQAGVDSMVGTIGPAEGLTILNGAALVIPMTITFNSSGAYNLDIWAEAQA